MTYTTLGAMEPHCSLDNGWTQEAIGDQVSRVINRLHMDTCPPKVQWQEQEFRLLPAPSFAFCFPLLRNVLEGKIAGLNQDDKAKLKCLAIISAHCEMREEAATMEIDEVGCS